jgi:hypothetical protein
MANTMPPLLRVRYIQPRTFTGLPSDSPERICLTDSIRMLKTQTGYKAFGAIGTDL